VTTEGGNEAPSSINDCSINNVSADIRRPEWKTRFSWKCTITSEGGDINYINALHQELKTITNKLQSVALRQQQQLALVIVSEWTKKIA
jgi:hypothetical protein